MAGKSTPKCPICDNCVLDYRQRIENLNVDYFDCPNCGRYHVDDITIRLIGNLNQREKAALSHGIWRGQHQEQPFEVGCQHIDAAKKVELPDPATQLDLLILFLGQNQSSSGARVDVPVHCLCAKIGASSIGDEIFVVDAASEKGLMSAQWRPKIPPIVADVRSLRLTLTGWQRFHKIQRGAVTSRTAFMAMPFKNSEVEKVFEEVFRPAVAETGFELKPVNVKQPAGLIDDQIRVDIRLSRFLIADLTCDNRGAYWEAGYAEGLGKPVIYTCNKYYFEHPGTHFDTNHCTTVIWDPEEPEEAADKLKATIRATLPFEARMEDESS